MTSGETYNGAMSGPRYRTRTWVRGHLPSPVWRLVGKGRRDCGDHEWYRQDDATDACYHCDVGQRPHESFGSPYEEIAADLRARYLLR